jgi:predicted permease
MADHSPGSGSPRAESRRDWTEQLRPRLALLRLSPTREADIIEELSQHLDQRYEELRAGGTGDADARRLAIEELADRDALSNEMRSLRQAHTAERTTRGVPSRFLLGDLWQDLRGAARVLRTQPGFAAAAVVTLALGIGATTAIFSVVNSVIIKPLPYADSDALVRIVHAIGGKDQPYFSDAVYLTYMENTQTFQDAGAWMPATRATVTGRGDPEEVRTLAASRGLLTTLGVQPEIGRWFSRAEDTRGAPDTVVLANGYWHRAFGGDRGVLERVLTIDGRPHQIIGVMPAGFRFDGEVEMIVPLRIDTARPIPFFRLVGVARLKPDVTLAQANADSSRILRMWLTNSGQKDPAFQARYLPSLRPLKQDIVGEVSRTLWVLMGAIGFVLLMACGNVASLLLVRADARRQEFAIRTALGARWTAVARQLLVESLMFAVIGGALGVGLAYVGLRVLVATGPSNLPRLSEISIDSVVLGFALTISLLSGVLFGLMPILKCARPRLADLGGGRGASLTRERQRTQHVLVVAQMTLALVLLVSAGLMIRSFQALRRVDPGFTEPHRVQTFGMSIPRTVVADPDRVMRLQKEVLDKIAAIPGVASAAFTTRLPTDPTDRWSAALSAEGKADDGRTPPNHQVKVISPGMFQTLGTPLVVGRDFTWTDLYDVRQVAIVSENLARAVWGSPAAAMGRRVREYYGPKDGPWREIIGVARDVVDDGAHQSPPTTIYWPARLNGVYQPRRVSVVIRAERAGTESLLEQVRNGVSSVHAGLPLGQVRTLGEVYQESMAQTSFTLVMLAIAGSMAMLLGISGLYGVISYAVSQRRREIGIRMALGARAPDIRGLFVRRSLILVGIGTAIGLGGAAGLTRLMQSLLFGISPLDPITFTAMPIVLAAAAVLASYVPARRAAAVDPVEVMRAE